MVINPKRNPISPLATPTSLPLNQEQRLRARVALALDRLAQLAFGLMVVTIPWRQRIVLQARPRPPLYADFSDLLLFTHDIFLLTLLLMWGAGLVLRPRRLATGPFFIWWPLLGLTTLALVSAITAVDPLLSTYHAFYLLLLAGLYLYAVNEVRQLHFLAAAVAVQLGLQSAVALAQGWWQQSLGLSWLGEHTLDLGAGSAFVWAEGALRSWRAYGLADHPNILAASLAFGMLLLAAWIVTSNGGTPAAATALFAASGVALLTTFSRDTWIIFAAGVLVTIGLFWRTRQRRPLERWLILLGVLLLLLLPAVWLRLPYLRLGTGTEVIAARVEERLYQAAEREALNRAANELFIGHAITGVGIGSLPVAMQQQTTGLGFDYQPARVTVLVAAAEVGLIGALFYFVLLLSPWLVLALRRQRLASPLLLGLTGVLAAVTLFGLFDAYTWSYPSGRLWQWLIWGVWAAAYREGKVSSEQWTVNSKR